MATKFLQKFRNLRNRVPFGFLCVYVIILCHFVLHGGNKEIFPFGWWIFYFFGPFFYFHLCDARLTMLQSDYIKPLIWFVAFFMILTGVNIAFQYEFPTMINYAFILQIILILMSIYVIVSRDIRESGEILQETSNCKGKRPSQRQMRIIEISCDFKSAFKRCVKSLDDYILEGWTVVKEKQGIISVKVIEWGNGGEVIRFKLKRIDDKNTMIVIKSQTDSLSPDRDGRNYKRIEEIVEFLNSSP